MNENKFTWVKTHKELVEIIRKKRNQQSQLIEALKKVGISGLHDENETIIFYDEKLTETKLVLLSLKGIKLNYEMLRQTKDD